MFHWSKVSYTLSHMVTWWWQYSVKECCPRWKGFGLLWQFLHWAGQGERHPQSEALRQHFVHWHERSVENISSPGKSEGINTDNRHGEGWGTQQLFCLSFLWQLLFPHLSSTWPQDTDWGNEVCHIINEDQIWDHLRNLNIHKSMGPMKCIPGSWEKCLM